MTTAAPETSTGREDRRRASTRADASTAAGAPVKTRWNRRLLLVGTLIALLCGVLAYWAIGQASTPRSVVVVAKDIAAGDVIEQGDLGTTTVSGGSDLTTLSAEQLPSLVGERAAVSMPAGTLANRELTMSRVVPREGQVIVGVALAPGQYPASGLKRGDEVRLVVTGGGQSIKTLPAGKAFSGTVLAVGDVAENGKVTVDLSIGAGEGDLAAAAAGTERIAVVNVAPVGAGPARSGE